MTVERYEERERRLELSLRGNARHVTVNDVGGSNTTTRSGDAVIVGWDAQCSESPPIELDAPPGDDDADATIGGFETLANALREEGARCGATQVDVALRDVRRAVRITHANDARSDLRRWTLLELRVHARRESESRLIQREAAFADPRAMAEGTSQLQALVRRTVEEARARLDDVAPPRGPTSVVFPAGADAGVFFHEVCGHPMEGDVVVNDGSFLSSRRGHRVAEAFVTVVDDPTVACGAVGYALDDEGTAASCVRLIDGGIGGEPLTDRRTAARLRLASNGHGRRVDFRHPALPRMSHTQLLPHHGTFSGIVSEVGAGVLIRNLTPRHVNLWTGEFSFYVAEAREIRDGQVGSFLKPSLLRGFALDALAGIEAVGGDLEVFFGLKGCGKLDQGGLPVSFGNPTVAFRSLWLEPSPV